ncbi:glycosyltransferase family 25 protein [Odoribacter lunatus]|uniref:glycosyltransferase family 25 protein n=1 Tax=Odoribacter lunatus TaxID=2941335 RepID=UPI00203DB488|nr:glycosyltransferase family 25 protein [Odoribacter lunatus]
MRTYIINLERSAERRKYMLEQLSSLFFLSVEFVVGVDGKLMNEKEKNEKFNQERFLLRYNQKVRPGEIGCTLSHQKCYRKLLESTDESVLILEDDIIIKEDIREIIKNIEKVLRSTQPRIVLLSGRYMYTRKQKFCECFDLVNVFNASFTHAYAINRAAAGLLVEKRPEILADDWNYIRRKGVKLKAVFPHVINQNWSGEYYTLVNDDRLERVKKLSALWLYRKIDNIFSKLLVLFGRYEKE